MLPFAFGLSVLIPPQTWWLPPPFLIMVGDALPELELRPLYCLVFFVLGWVVMFNDQFIDAAGALPWRPSAASATVAG